MGKLTKNQSGFAVMHAVLVLVVLTIVGFTGWYVYSANKTASDDLKSSSSDAKFVHKKKGEASAKTITDETADWTSYTSTKGKFTIKHPKGWAMATHPELCGDDILLIGADSASVGKCGSEDFGQMSITWRSDRQVCGGLNDDSWTQDSKETVSVAGVSANKITATAKAPSADLGTVPEGTKTVQYCFVANGTTYILDYTKLSSYPDALSDFNLMVTKTFKLQS